MNWWRSWTCEPASKCDENQTNSAISTAALNSVSLRAWSSSGPAKAKNNSLAGSSSISSPCLAACRAAMAVSRIDWRVGSLERRRRFGVIDAEAFLRLFEAALSEVLDRALDHVVGCRRAG